jgi:hypothetical protein
MLTARRREPHARSGIGTMNAEELPLETLEDHVRAIAVAESAADVFRALLEASRSAAPRASVFLLRQGQLKGWGAVGYPPDAARRQRDYVGAPTGGWLGEVVRSEPPLHTTEAGAALLLFGQPAPSESIGMSVRVKGRPIAVMAWERLEGELPWRPAALPLLVRVAQLRLDLDLALRKLAAPASAPARSADPPPRTSPAAIPFAAKAPSAVPAPARAPEPAEPQTAVVEIAEAAPLPASETPVAEDPRLAPARRYARLVATDIRLYNEEAVMLGRRDGDLAERLKESLLRGKETFLRRHGDLGAMGIQLLHEAYIDVLAGGEARLLPPAALA